MDSALPAAGRRQRGGARPESGGRRGTGRAALQAAGASAQRAGADDQPGCRVPPVAARSGPPWNHPLMHSLPERILRDEASVFTLPDRRALAYLEWGDSAGYPAFYFHGTPSSRLEGAFADGAAQRTGFRLIAVARPGVGRSTFQEGRTFRDWPADVCALA